MEVYIWAKNNTTFISSESYSLKKIKCEEIFKINDLIEIDVPISNEKTLVIDEKIKKKKSCSFSRDF